MKISFYYNDYDFSYTMVITVTDGGSPSVKTGTTTVIMTVLPVNDNDPAAGTATCSTVRTPVILIY